MSKIIAVIGATGNQGGSVVREVLKLGGWTVRGLTRNADSDAAKNLKAQGVEVVAGDANKKEDLARAFAGADAVFSNTISDYKEGGFEREVALGKLIVDVAKEQGVKHFIYSSEENAEEISKGKNKVWGFTTKAKVEEYMNSTGIPASVVELPGYFENFKLTNAPKLNDKGVYELVFPVPSDSKVVIGCANEVGQLVAMMIQDREKWVGKRLFLCGDYLTPNEVVAVISKVWKKPVVHTFIPPSVFATFPFSGAAQVADMFDFMHHFGYAGEKVNGRDVFDGKKACPTLSTLEQWVEKELPSPDAIVKEFRHYADH